MVARSYVPDRGDLVWITMNPQAGHEQAGRRPAVVLSPNVYNQKTKLALFCPITNQEKGYPFEVRLPSGITVKGVVLADQLKNLDWQARNVEKITTLPVSAVETIVRKFSILLA